MSTEINTLLVSSPEICGGRLHIAGTEVTVNQIVSLYKQGYGAEAIADELPQLTMAQIYSALAHYHANRDEFETVFGAEKIGVENRSLGRETRLEAFKALQRNLGLTPTKAAEWQNAIREARR